MQPAFRLLLCPLLLALATSILPAEEPVLKEHVFDGIGAKARIPESWHIREDSEEGVVVYQVTRDNISEQSGEFSVGFTLSMTPDVPSRAGMKASAYASDLLSFAVEDGAKIVETEAPPFKIFRAEYAVDGDIGASEIVDLATANDTTGTLYFLAWQNPAAETSALAPLREQILSSFVFDPSR